MSFTPFWLFVFLPPPQETCVMKTLTMDRLRKIGCDLDKDEGFNEYLAGVTIVNFISPANFPVLRKIADRLKIPREESTTYAFACLYAGVYACGDPPIQLREASQQIGVQQDEMVSWMAARKAPCRAEDGPEPEFAREELHPYAGLMGEDSDVDDDLETRHHVRVARMRDDD